MRFDYVSFDVPGDLLPSERREFALGLAQDLFGKRAGVEVVSVHGHGVRVRRAVRRTSHQERRQEVWV